MSKPVKKKPTRSVSRTPPPPPFPPRNGNDVLATEQLLEPLVVWASEKEWTKPLPPYPALCAADNLQQEKWIFHILNRQNLDRMINAASMIDDRTNWQRQSAELALELAEVDLNVAMLRTVIVEALTTCFGEEYAKRANAAIDIVKPKGRRTKIKSLARSLVEEGARVADQIERLLEQLQQHYRKQPTKNRIQWSSNHFAVRYLRDVRKRNVNWLEQSIKVRRQKKAVDSDPTHR